MEWAARREDGPPFPVVSLARPNMAKEILTHAQNHDHVIIDGPPRAEALSRAVIIASDVVVLPVEPSGASDWASGTTIRQVEEARVLKPHLRAAFVVSRHIPGTVISTAIRAHVAEHGIPLLTTAIANRVAFAEAMTQGLSVFEWAPRSEAAKEIFRLTKEIGKLHEQEDNRPSESADQRTA